MSTAEAVQLAMTLIVDCAPVVERPADGRDVRPNHAPAHTDLVNLDEESATARLGKLMGPAFSSFAATFRRIDIASELIETFAQRHRSREIALRQSFLALRWELSITVVDRVFRAHVGELLQRVVDEASLVDGTRAEVLMVLSEASLKSPLGAQAAALFETLFGEIWAADSPFKTAVTREPWTGASVEMLQELRRKLRTPERKLSPKEDT